MIIRRIHTAAVATLLALGVATAVVASCRRADAPADTREVHFIFSADSTFEGAPKVLDLLDSAGIKGSFFFTGNFIRRPENGPILRRIIDGGHYVGPHSDAHLLLADWDEDKTILVTVDSLMADTRRVYQRLDSIGVDTASARIYLPPYEWAGDIHVDALTARGYRVVFNTPGILTYRDYTVPNDRAYLTADSMERQLYRYEREHSLDGALILIHLGTDSCRTDKLYDRMPRIIDTLLSRGYDITRLR